MWTLKQTNNNDQKKRNKKRKAYTFQFLKKKKKMFPSTLNRESISYLSFNTVHEHTNTDHCRLWHILSSGLGEDWSKSGKNLALFWPRFSPNLVLI